MSRASPLPAALEDLIESGLAAQRSGNLPLATERYTQVLALAPANFDGLQLLGLARIQSGSVAEGIGLLRRALTIEPKAVQVIYNLGTALRETGDYLESARILTQGLQATPGSVDLLANLALTLIGAGQLSTASRVVERATALEPGNPITLYAHGNLLRALHRPMEAIAHYRRVLERGAPTADVHLHLGLALQEVGELDESWECLNRYERLKPGAISRLHRAYAGLLCARWDGFQDDCAALAAATGQDGLDPFALLHFPLGAAELRRHIGRFADGIAAKGRSLQPPGVPLEPAPRRSRVRIAYLSPDLRDHPVGMLLAGMLPLHDRRAFEIQVYSFGPDDASTTRQRIAAACDRFEDVREVPYQSLVALLRERQIDVAIDLAGVTAGNRLGVLAARVAPVQVGWLGYPGTTGILDYLIADARIVPPGAEAHYSEHLLRLPQTYLPYDGGQSVDEPRSRREYGLPESALVLAYFGQLRKINPLVFDAWMQVLRAVPEAVLWLSAFHIGSSPRPTSAESRTTDPTAAANLRRAAAARGVAPERLIFAGHEPSRAAHLARYQVADIALDTYPYGSHSTAADALSAGCLLVSVAGDSFASRVSSSILAAAGLPELATSNLGQYARMLTDLARDPPRRAALKARLIANRDCCPLFDIPRFARAFEGALQAVHDRRLSGMEPVALDVDDAGGARPADAAAPEHAHEVAALVRGGLEELRAGGRQAAAARFEQALSLDPECFDALQLLGVLRFRSGQVESGIALMQRALAQDPRHAPTLNNLGNALRAAGRLDEALEVYRRAIEAPEQLVASCVNLGTALIEKGDLPAAYAAFSRACELDPTILSARAPRAALARVLIEWQHVDADLAALCGEPAALDPAPVDPGPLLCLALPPRVQRRYADTFARHLRGGLAPSADLASTRTSAPRLRAHGPRPLRVAYLSADLRGHAVGYLLAPLFEAHDRGRVTCLAYTWHAGRGDDTGARIERAVDLHRHVAGLTDPEVRTLLATDEVDVAVDLMGYTAFSRPALFAQRVAPVQLGWLGYAGTLGGGLLDFLIADEFIVPREAEVHYAEAILRLPGTYLPYDPSRPVSTPRSRGDYGLPDDALVLAALAPARKLAPTLFAVWLEVLKELPEAVLWLGPVGTAPGGRLRALARTAGIDERRLVFAEAVDAHADHLARYHVADLVLDTYPYGSHSTAADALHVGCPIVALVGDAFAARVSGSICRAAGMPELVTETLEAYHQRVLELARDRGARDALRARIAAQRARCSLFDLGRFVDALETNFEAAFDRRFGSAI